MTDSVKTPLTPCPWCGTNEHLSITRPGSLTGDMPGRPAAVICTHIDHDTVQGPTAYGDDAARAAWNARSALSMARQSVEGAHTGEGQDGAVQRDPSLGVSVFPLFASPPNREGQEVVGAKERAFRRVFMAWEAWDIPDETPLEMIDAMESAAQLFFADPGLKQQGVARSILAAKAQPHD